MSLNDKQERFCQEYLVDLNATQAAIRAGYSPRSARSQAADLLTKPNIEDRIAQLMAERQERTQVTQDQVIRELALLAFSDVRHYKMDDSGRLDLAEGAPASATRAISSVKHKSYTRDDVTTHEAEYRLWGKPDALKTLANHLGMLTDKLEVGGKDGQPLRFSLNLGGSAITDDPA